MAKFILIVCALLMVFGLFMVASAYGYKSIDLFMHGLKYCLVSGITGTVVLYFTRN